MKDLGVVGEDFWSLALGINDEGQIVGTSANADFSVLRAFLRQNGALVDLNTLVAGTTALFLETACSINSRGEIIGFAFDPNTSYIHAYLAIPTPSD
jgi:probable HAF family extracellular repeat protein